MKKFSGMLKVVCWFLSFMILVLVSSCQTVTLVLDEPILETSVHPSLELSQSEQNTLNSLRQIDSYPLYTMDYQAMYDNQSVKIRSYSAHNKNLPSWGCSLFAVFGDSERMWFGRNFDWDFSPGLLLFTHPPGGYASVSMVDLYYLGYGGEQAYGLTDLPLEAQAGLLDAPFIPFDGMNETGLAVGMAAVPPGDMEEDPSKETIDSVMVIRKILDGAANIQEAVDIIKSYNIDMGSGPPLHYLIADRSGKSALVEFSQGEMIVIYNSEAWQPTTNFLMSEAEENPERQCWRYELISQRLEENKGKLSDQQAMGILKEVAQESTQWSVVYGMTSGEILITMGGDYKKEYKLELDLQ
jgi:hypothetical protein